MCEMEKSLECPFTWEIDTEVVPEYETTTVSKDLENNSVFVDQHHPLHLIMRHVTFAYTDTVRKDYDNARKCLQKIVKTWNDIDQSRLTKENMSVKVVIHIIEATKYNTYKQIGDSTEASKVLVDLQDFKNFNSQIDLGTLNGCKSLLWQILYKPGKKNAIHFAKLATTHNPNCSLWHLILGKQLRYIRRQEEFSKVPSDDEASAFLESYKLSKCPNNGIFVAQMYREMSNYNMSNEIYLEIYDMNPRDLDIQLRLALGFIRKKDFERAKSCLDYVEQLAPQDCRVLHYKGIYFHKQNNFKMAVKYFKEASKDGKNFQAEIQYIFSMQTLDKNFDSIEYCQAILEKYKNIYYKQQIFIMIALDYISRKQYVNALKYFLEAIKLDPENNKIKKYFDMHYNKYINIIHVIRYDLLPKIKELSAISVDVKNMLAETETLISRYV